MLIDGEKLLKDLESSALENKIDIGMALLVKRLVAELMIGCRVPIKSPEEIERAIKYFQGERQKLKRADSTQVFKSEYHSFEDIIPKTLGTTKSLGKNENGKVLLLGKTTSKKRTYGGGIQ